MNKQILERVVVVGLFAVPFVPLLISSSFFFPFITFKAFAFRIIVEVVFAAWLILAISDPAYRPKRSPILYALLAFLVVIGLADVFGSAPVKSFWSNFERMEGYITLLHLGAFFVVASSVFDEGRWKKWWNTTLAASVIMALYALFQVFGVISPNQAGSRVDGTFGNTIYLAVYMLFHIFIALMFMWREWRNSVLRLVYALLILLQTFILYHTATRGAIIGLVGGIFVAALLSAFNREEGGQTMRRAGILTLVAVIVFIGGFFVLKDSSLVSSNPVLSRFSSLTFSEIKTQGRYFVWPIAYEGWKEKPIFGWGQENFSYVFQKYYKPEMFHLEPWFDRAHNIFLDWMVAGGALGLLSYLSLYVALMVLVWRSSSGFSHTEKSILTGLVAAYFFHNFFVFDHLMSYVLFFSLLAYVHSRGDGPVLWQGVSLKESRAKTFALPVVIVVLILILFFVNIKPLNTNLTLIRALKSIQTGNSLAAAEYFKKAHGSSRLGRSEAVEQMVSNARIILTSDISMEDKNDYFTFVRSAVEKETLVFADDARYALFAGSFLSMAGYPDEALVHLERARALSPKKQQILFEIGSTYLIKEEPQRALEFLREAYESASSSTESRIIYLIGAIYASDRLVEAAMLETLGVGEVAFDDRILNAYYLAGRSDMVRRLLEERINLDPANEAVYRGYIENLQGPASR